MRDNQIARDSELSTSKSYGVIYSVVRRIPSGRVATYGQVADLAGLRGYARQVGYALNALSEDHDVPWHRVINARGEISLRGYGGYDVLQRRLLEAEGVFFDEDDRVSFSQFGWRPRSVVGRRSIDGHH